MIFTLLWADSTIHCDLCDAIHRYLELNKEGNKYVVHLFDCDNGCRTIERYETKSYDEAHMTFCMWVYLFRMGIIHEEDNSETYAYINSQHD